MHIRYSHRAGHALMLFCTALQGRHRCHPGTADISLLRDADRFQLVLLDAQQPLSRMQAMEFRDTFAEDLKLVSVHSPSPDLTLVEMVSHSAAVAFQSDPRWIAINRLEPHQMSTIMY